MSAKPKPWPADALYMEAVVSTRPFVLRRRVRWSECDPAGVVFAGNFSMYAHNAIEMFRAQVFDVPWMEAIKALGIDTPAKSISLVFKRALWPSEVFDMKVLVKELRNSTMVFSLEATLESGEPVFDAEVTMIAIKWGPRRAVPMPDELRGRLQAYQAACEEA